MTAQKKISRIMDHILTKDADLIKVTVGINRTEKFINFYALFKVSSFRFQLDGLSDLMDEMYPNPDHSNFECYSRPLREEEAYFRDLLGEPIKNNQIIALDIDIKL